MFAKNYMKPGPGVEKRDPNQSRISIFFEIFGERFWDIVKLNLLYFLFSIPAFIITFIVTGFLSTSILNPMIDANAPVGVFDSGVGGLTVVREIMRQMPQERIVYFGDTARLPYGTKSQETVIRYSRQIIRF